MCPDPPSREGKSSKPIRAPAPTWYARTCPAGCDATPPSTKAPRHAPGVPDGQEPKATGPRPTRTRREGRPRDWVKATIDVRGHAVDKLIHTRDVLWEGVNPKELVRLVVVRDPAGVEPDDFFVTTDLSASGADTAARYAGRCSIEVCFRDVKQDLGGENPRSWKRQGPKRAACLLLWLHATTWCWYLAEHPAATPGSPDPGTPAKEPQASSTPLPRYAATLWSQRITTISTDASTGHEKDQNYRRPTRHSRLRRLRVRKVTVSVEVSSTTRSICTSVTRASTLSSPVTAPTHVDG